MLRPLLFAGSLALAGTAHAGDVHVGLFTGLVAPGPRHELYAPADALQAPLNLGGALGARMSWRPIPLLGLEAQGHGALSSVEDRGDALLYAYRAQAQLFPPLDLPFEPFATLGLGNLGINSSVEVLGADVDWAGNLGLGARIPLGGPFSLRADLNHLLADRNTVLKSPGGHTELLVGLDVRLTAERDRDEDGIGDSKDGCIDDAEVHNGYADDDGCPDELASVSLQILDSEGLPAQDITVIANGVEIGRTSAGGRLVLSEQMPGEPLVLRGEHFHMERPEETLLEPVEGTNEATLTITWLPGRVRIVTMADGAPMVGATAAFTGPTEVAAAGVKDGDELFFLAPGDWQILVTADTYGTELVDLSIGPDERSLIVIEMALEPAKVQVTRDEMVILQQILFESGSAEIQGGSLDLMSEVTGTLLANPHIQLIEIQGHTDAQGSASSNRRLSQSRVESVMAWMVAKGVAAQRLQAKGFGEDDPIAPNHTADGRAKNRRVVFSILEQELESEQ